MKLMGFIRGENVIVAMGGVEYSYEMLGERDSTLTDGDEVSFDTLASSAINIERVDTSKSKDRAAQKAASQAKEATKQNSDWISDPKNFIEIDAAEESSPQNSAENIAEDRSAAKVTKIAKKFKKFKLPRKAKPAGAKKPKFLGFEFVQMDDPREGESLESKIYTNPIRMSGIKAYIMPLILIGIALIFRAQITESLLSFKQIQEYVNQNTVSLTFDLFIYLIFALSYILPLNQVFIFLSAARHDQYAVRQITSYNIFLIICVVATVLQNETIGLDAYVAIFSIAVALFGLLSYCYKLKAFLYLIFTTKGSLPFLIAIAVELCAIIAIGVMDAFSGLPAQITQITGIDFNTMAWKHIVIFAISAPFYIFSFICLRRIKKAKI
ncbi:hypothetical protein [uncultured Campylobacter sp.]|uniref:hypothetical protein n=1 Tax=uncultured Campylobacter sp. TaxID=218934 RepID=UPI00260BDBD7|nr:hypothetical protein [uncultured Campylobacter sp.]